MDNIEFGFEMARKVSGADIGQTVVVKGRVVVALEGLEGTDAAIRRAHELAGEGLVVVKIASPHQDRRFDLPVIGRDTLETLTASKVTCLALESRSTLLLDRSALVASANDATLCIVGVAAHEPTP